MVTRVHRERISIDWKIDRPSKKEKRGVDGFFVPYQGDGIAATLILESNWLCATPKIRR